MGRTIVRALIVTAALLLAGCTTYTWERPGLDPVTAERQREIDTAECTVAAMQAVPKPDSRLVTASAAEPLDYSVQGTATIYGPGGEVQTGYYSGTATPAGGGGYTAPGIAQAQFLTDSYNATNARAGLANACMLRRGWVKVKAGQEAMAAAAPGPAYTAPASPNALAQIPTPVSSYSASVSPPANEAPLPLVLPAPSPARYSEWSKTQGR